MLVSAPLAFDAVLYAKDLAGVAAFYQQVLGVVPLEAAPTHVALLIGGGRLWIHAVPAAHASSIQIAQPPELREEAAIKLSFPVASLSAARELATAHGGGAGAPERAWEHQGMWHLDAWDSEGNVIQFRAAST
jgi:predicted enzyme related to lactoylglutathione lyase